MRKLVALALSGIALAFPVATSAKGGPSVESVVIIPSGVVVAQPDAFRITVSGLTSFLVIDGKTVPNQVFTATCRALFTIPSLNSQFPVGTAVRIRCDENKGELWTGPNQIWKV